jgi:hypothetical protein
MLLRLQVASPLSRQPVVFAKFPVHDLVSPHQQALAFEPMEPRIEMAGAHTVAVVGQLFNHPEAVEGHFGSVVEDVQLYKIDVKIVISIHDIEF